MGYAGFDLNPLLNSKTAARYSIQSYSSIRSRAGMAPDHEGEIEPCLRGDLVNAPFWKGRVFDFAKHYVVQLWVQQD